MNFIRYMFRMWQSCAPQKNDPYADQQEAHG